MSHLQFSARDDAFHFDQMSDRWWETETCWFSFYHPQRKLGGWLYTMVRPNIGTVAGGAWVWDDTAHLPWEVLYSANYTALRLPRDQDLTDIQLPTGVSVRAIEPLTSYEIGYEDGDRLQARLRFDAVMPPMALTSGETGFGGLGHFDQFGRVSGHIVLRGETIDIDCLSMRDRSWGPRPEHRPRRTTYVTAMADPANGWLAMTNPAAGGDPIRHGFLLQDGVAAEIREGNRAVERDPTQGWITRITVQGVDVQGRRLHAVGEAVSRIIINRHTFIDINSLVRWTFADGSQAWGEDQDIWPVHEWASARRAG